MASGGPPPPGPLLVVAAGGRLALSVIVAVGLWLMADADSWLSPMLLDKLVAG